MDESIRSCIDNLNQKEAMLLLIAAMDRINQTIINDEEPLYIDTISIESEWFKREESFRTFIAGRLTADGIVGEMVSEFESGEPKCQ